jgi:hypothetical protein
MEAQSARRRQIRACQRCRTLKVRCDTQRPTCARRSKAGARCVSLPEAVASEEGPADQGVGSDAGKEQFNVKKPLPTSKVRLVTMVQLDPSPYQETAFAFTCPATFGTLECEKCPSQKRRRVPISCARCRQLKVRCDRNHPCSRCTKAKSGCTYSQGVSSTPRSQASGVQFDPAGRAAQWKAKFRSDAHWIRLAFEVIQCCNRKGLCL